MKCPTCGHENRVGAKFCEACASSLQPVCASCGAALRPTAKVYFGWPTVRVLHLVDETGAERWRSHVHAERAALLRLRGDAAAARRELTEAHRLFAATGAGGHAARVAAVLAEIPADGL